MESNIKPYDVANSAKRIDAILALSNDLLEESNTIPKREKLTYTNGFYVNCTALFADIRGSTDLTDAHRRPRLAKLYRSFLSETVALVNSNEHCAEVNIIGDCVSAIFDTPYKSGIESVFSTAAKLAVLVKILNYKLDKAGIQQIQVGIGMAYGRALMIQAGLTGTGINDVVWMGDVVNSASNLSAKAYENGTGPIVVSNVVYSNLNEHSQSLLRSRFGGGYSGDFVDVGMNEWYKANCT